MCWLTGWGGPLFLPYLAKGFVFAEDSGEGCPSLPLVVRGGVGPISGS